ncbi:MAG: DEAD/DEAH box helicase [Candidatus Methanomethylophilaceae archaeon]
MTTSFVDIGVSDRIIRAMSEMGWKEPTPIQVDAIPVGLKGGDMFAQAQTGTGKTGAYGCIILGRVGAGSKIPSTMVLVPTRELANQVSEELSKLSKYTKHRCLAIYGGASIDSQVRKLRRGVDIVVGTPGRVKDLILRHELDLSVISMVVLDEADRMLDMGFSKDLDFILSNAPKKRQTLLLSATMSDDIRDLALNGMRDATEIIVSKDELILDLTTQYFIPVSRNKKRTVLCDILSSDRPKAIVFCQTKHMVDALTSKLKDAEYRVAAIHGGLAQNKREKVVRSFKNDELDVLVATDVAARGLDIDNIDYVINYDMPSESETYVHRIGRTGRAGKEGVAITFVTPDERYRVPILEYDTGVKIMEMEAPLGRIERDSKTAEKITEAKGQRNEHSDNRKSECPRTDMGKDKTPTRKSKGIAKSTTDKTDSATKEMKSATGSDDKVSIEINLGRLDGASKATIFDFIKHSTKLPDGAIGRIGLGEAKSQVEIHRNNVDIALDNIACRDFRGKPVKGHKICK